MISGTQIKMARKGLNWSLQKLAAKANLSSSSIRRLESFSGMPSARARSLCKIKETFEQEGVVFCLMSGVHLPEQLCE